jgi:uncharacterized membrane protein
MNFFTFAMQLLTQVVEHLERLEQLLIRVGLALWHILGMLFIFYMLFAEKLSGLVG